MEVGQRLAREYVGRADLVLYSWERKFMEATSDFQSAIPHPSEFDIFLGLLWSRLGSPLDPSRYRKADLSAYRSGTEYEFELARTAHAETGQPKMFVFIKTEPPRIIAEKPEDVEEFSRQWRLLEDFKKHWFHDGQYFQGAHHSFRTEEELDQQIEDLFRQKIEERLSDEQATREIIWTGGSPFRGLRPFETTHSELFFGRRQATKEVLRLLKAQAERGIAFVLVFGASGVGKSSLLRAGVVPQILRSQWLEEVYTWRYANVVPSAALGEAGDELRLAEALIFGLTRAGGLPELLSDGEPRSLAWMMREEPGVLAGLVRGALGRLGTSLSSDVEPPRVRLVLVLDQLEEVFTREDVTDREREAFFRAIELLARSGTTYVLASLRSEFFEQCTRYESLSELKKNATYHLRAPNRNQLDEMVRRPAAMAGLTYESSSGGRSLSQVLLDDAGDEGGALPLLQFTLQQLYDRMAPETRTLTFKAYADLGGLSGALQNHAEDTYGRLPVASKMSLPDVLAGLAGINGDHGDLRLVRRTAELDAFQGAPRGLVDAFIDAYLFTSDADVKGVRLVSVTHEALLNEWTRVRSWATQNQEYLRTSARLRMARTSWLDSEGEPARLRESLLWREGRRLQDARFLLDEHASKLSTYEVDFLNRSTSAARRLSRRRLIGQTALVTVTTAVVSGATVYAFTNDAYQRELARQSFGPVAAGMRDYLARGRDVISSAMAWSRGSIFMPGPRKRFERYMERYNKARNNLYENRNFFLISVKRHLDADMIEHVEALFDFQENHVHQKRFRPGLGKPMDAVYDYFEPRQKASTAATPQTTEERAVLTRFAEAAKALVPAFDELEQKVKALERIFANDS